MLQHAKLSASGSSKWLNCPGSINAEDEYVSTHGYPAAGSFAEEGTRAHTLGENCLIEGTDPEFYVGDTIDGIEIPDDMAVAVQKYVDYVRRFSGDLHVEIRLNLNHIIPDGFGTCDALVVNGDTLHVIDYKHGMGVKVDAEHNSQMKLYALGALRIHEDIEHVHLHVVQPRISNFSSWATTARELKVFGEEVKIKAAKTQNPDAPRVPSDVACKWCKAKATCPELLDITAKVVSMDFEDMTKASSTDIKYILDNEKLIASHIKAVKEHAMQHVPTGYKLVASRTQRKWLDEDRAAALLGATAYNKKIISPTQALKMKVLPAGLEDLIYKPQGTPTLVPESDKRSAMTEDFDNLA